MNTIFQTKCYFLAIIFLLISFCNMYAQQDDAKPCRAKKEIFAFGPKLSVNATNLCISKQLRTDFLAGADLGLFFRFSPGRLYIQPEIYYQIRNTKIMNWMDDSLYSGPSYDDKYATYHIDIPIIIGIKAIDFKFFKLRFFAGPEFNVKLKDGPIKNYYQLGLITGLGLDIWRFTIDASYSFVGYIYPYSRSCNNIIKVGVGFKCF